MNGKEVIELLKTRRSIRQFSQKELPREIIRACIDTARLSPSAANLQPLEYFYVDDNDKCDQIFPLLQWAAYIQPAGDPQPDQRPTAYLTVLLNQEKKQIKPAYETGAAIENFIIAAWAYGIGTCWLLSVDREQFRTKFNVPDKYKIDSVIAIGYPAEKPVVEPYEDDIKYWQDEQGKLHVPKRSLEDILTVNSFKD
ncbi:MAG: nitroreductase family protein [Candidatus Marinimicrobia bacterium]|nr:nitroreductase family protein [Candidatus Neomarinimicrobiota bacterium]